METMKYEEAVHQLEAIVAKMEQGELDVDTMAEQLKKAQELIIRMMRYKSCWLNSKQSGVL